MRLMERDGTLACATVLLAALTAACSGSNDSEPAGTFPSEPYTTVLGDAGRLRITVWTAPEQPPTRGVASVKLAIANASTSAALDDLRVDVVPWMPAMGHGTSVIPTVTANGGGFYVITNVNLYMPGHWELRSKFSDGVQDSAAPAFDVP